MSSYAKKKLNDGRWAVRVADNSGLTSGCNITYHDTEAEADKWIAVMSEFATDEMWQGRIVEGGAE